MTQSTVTVRYLRDCPRGFANEVFYYRVRADEIGEAEAFMAAANGDVNRLVEWTDDPVARRPWVALDWADRGWA